MRRFVAALACAMIVTTLPAYAAPFTITSTTATDGTLGEKDFGGAGNDASGKPCGGADASPQLSWSNAPPKTQSYALLMLDPDGRKPVGVSHWVFYNIPGNVTSLNRGDGTPKQPRYTLGKGTAWMGFRGPCPPIGDGPHHYVLTVYALDLPPTLPAELDRDGLLKAMTGHTLASTTMDILYQR